MAWRFGSLSRSLVSAARASSLRSSPPLPFIRPPSSDAPFLQSRSFSLDASSITTSDLPRQKVDKKTKAANSCSEFLTFMGGLDGEQKQLVKKLVNFRMKGGKRTKVRSIFYKTLHRLAQSENDVIEITSEALENVKPICEVEKVGIAGSIYDVPRIVPRERQQTLAVRWILEAAEKRRTSKRISLEKCLSAEILDAYRKKGVARKKRENIHGVAANNRGFAHYRWW